MTHTAAGKIVTLAHAYMQTHDCTFSEAVRAVGRTDWALYTAYLEEVRAAGAAGPVTLNWRTTHRFAAQAKAAGAAMGALTSSTAVAGVAIGALAGAFASTSKLSPTAVEAFPEPVPVPRRAPDAPVREPLPGERRIDWEE